MLDDDGDYDTDDEVMVAITMSNTMVVMQNMVLGKMGRMIVTAVCDWRGRGLLGENIAVSEN